MPYKNSCSILLLPTSVEKTNTCTVAVSRVTEDHQLFKQYQIQSSRHTTVNRQRKEDRKVSNTTGATDICYNRSEL